MAKKAARSAMRRMVGAAPGLLSLVASIGLLAFAAAAQAPPAPDPDVANATSLLPKDLSPWGMFLTATLVVKAVMASLALASVATWTVALAKGIELVAARRSLRLRRRHPLRVARIPAGE